MELRRSEILWHFWSSSLLTSICWVFWRAEKALYLLNHIMLYHGTTFRPTLNALWTLCVKKQTPKMLLMQMLQ